MKKPLLILTTLALAQPVCGQAALPAGGNVVSGSATIQTGGSVMTVTQTTPATITNWNAFSVGVGNAAQFNQPGASSAVLNRVITTNPSLINGQVSANGSVYLVNPNGIVVGPTGQVNAFNVILSTGNLADPDFNAGTIVLDAAPAGSRILIAGSVTAGYLFWANSAQIEVTGVVDARSTSINSLTVFCNY